MVDMGTTNKVSRINTSLTVMNDVMVHEVLHETNSRRPIQSLLVTHQPVDQLLRHKAVRIRPQVVAPILDQFSVVKPQP